MLKLFTGVFIIALALNFTNSAEQEDGGPVIDEDLPLIFIKTDRGDLIFPTNVKLKKKLLRKAKIKFSQFLYDKQIFYCPSETKKQKDNITKANEIYKRKPNRLGDEISNDCLFRKKKIEKGARFPKCENSLQPQMMTVLKEKQTTATDRNNEDIDSTSELTTCGPSNAGQMFAFGYQICEEYEGFEKFVLYPFSNKKETYPFRVMGIEFLEICYNTAISEILYISHTIMAPSLLKNNLLEKEVLKKPSEEIRTDKLNHIEIDFERIETIFETIDASKTIPFKIQLLAPLDDFPLVSWKKPAYHYVNVNLMHANLESYWNLIHNMIRENAKITARYFTIHTRVLKISFTPASIKEIEDAYKIKIPSIWVKLVHHRKERGERKALAIFANNYRHKEVENFIIKNYSCPKNLCQYTLKNNFEKVNTSDFRCCQVTKEIQELFGLVLNFYDVLVIPNLSRDGNLPRAETSPSRI